MHSVCDTEHESLMLVSSSTLPLTLFPWPSASLLFPQIHPCILVLQLTCAVQVSVSSWWNTTAWHPPFPQNYFPLILKIMLQGLFRVTGVLEKEKVGNRVRLSVSGRLSKVQKSWVRQWTIQWGIKIKLKLKGS